MYTVSVAGPLVELMGIPCVTVTRTTGVDVEIEVLD